MLPFLYLPYVDMEGDKVTWKVFLPSVTTAFLLFVGWQAPQKPVLRLQVAFVSNQGDEKSKRPTQTFTPPLQTDYASYIPGFENSLNLSEQNSKRLKTTTKLSATAYFLKYVQIILRNQASSYREQGKAMWCVTWKNGEIPLKLKSGRWF